MLVFEPQSHHYDIPPATLPTIERAEEPLPEQQYQLFTAIRDENRLLASDVASYRHSYKTSNKRRQRIPVKKDLALIRNH